MKWHIQIAMTEPYIDGVYSIAYLNKAVDYLSVLLIIEFSQNAYMAWPINLYLAVVNYVSSGISTLNKFL